MIEDRIEELNQKLVDEIIKRNKEIFNNEISSEIIESFKKNKKASFYRRIMGTE